MHACREVSGHGTQIKNLDGTERDDLDEGKLAVLR